jgi:ketosteroid isomerase-like protein
MEIGKRLVELCNAGKNQEAMQALYGETIVSVEAGGPPGASLQTTGLAAVVAKSAQFGAAHEFHAGTCEGPWPHGDRFIVRFVYDLTQKASGHRFVLDEAALFTTANGKIVREEFFFAT